MAVVTSLAIVNEALVFLGEDALASFPLAGSLNSDRLAVFYENVKEKELAKYNWNFAIFREDLTKDSTNPINEYSSQFSLPTDTLRILDVWPRGIRWKVENTANGLRILADSTTLAARFLKNVTEDQMPKYFASVIAARLAILLSTIITERDSKFQHASSWYSDVVTEARRLDSNEMSTDQMDDLEVVRGRSRDLVSGIRYGVVSY